MSGSKQAPVVCRRIDVDSDSELSDVDSVLELIATNDCKLQLMDVVKEGTAQALSGSDLDYGHLSSDAEDYDLSD